MSAPDSWSTAALGDVCTVVSGATPKTGVAGYWGGDIGWITPNDMSRDRSQVLTRGERSLTQAGYDSCSARIFPAGSVIVSSRAPVGYVAIAGAPLSTNQGCKTAVPPEFLDSRYLYWYLVAAKRDLEARASGTTFKEISAKRFAETLLIWPELAEQRRIVEILEGHLSHLDAADAEVARCRVKLDALWAATLSEARIGSVTPLPEVADVQGGIQKQPRRAPTVNHYPFLRVANVTSSGLDLADVHRVELFGDELTRLRLEPGDLLVVEGNGSASQIGRAARWDGSIEDCVHQNHLIRVRPKESMLPGYLEAVWNSPEHRQKLMDIASSSSGLYTLSVSKLKQLTVPLPSLDEQRRVVGRVDEVRTSIRRLEGTLVVAKTRAESLRRALLAAAFEGKLTGRHTDYEAIEERAGAFGAEEDMQL